MRRLLAAGLFGMALAASSGGAGEDEPVPHGQNQAPGEPLSPAEAIQKMTVPEGFKVELVASEPDLVNPVAMTFDERGRIWVTESLEYPRKPAGPGKDRVKVLEDTDGDGKADRFSIFAEGFNIPSGIAVGHGGVWVANSPDILFLQDTDGDGKADRREVVVTGFGRDDTHELPNSLTWGPDGWLYGWNGVFNQSRVEYRGKTYEFTCAIFRIHPRTREFELFCAGTSNPWGITWDPEGSAFASACVIDHLWHLTESGYYHRQGGPYPPFTWEVGSIVDHAHQKAAYCGIHYFDSDAYPRPYRDRLYMGNIHGGCINVDVLKRNGSTYKAEAAPDFLTAHDAWCMPVAQKTGPDGCLYILDWYDRYHCYQDANRDPDGIDRLKGRLYRVRYKDAPRVFGFDLARETDDQLIERLKSPNLFFRDLAQRLLAERNLPETRTKLHGLVSHVDSPRKTRMHALWALIGGGPLETGFHRSLLDDADPTVRAWGVRAAGDMHRVEPSIREKTLALARDPAPDVALQVAIAARKLDGVKPMPVLLDVLASCGADPLIPPIVWQNLHPLLEDHADEFIRLVERPQLLDSANVARLMPRVIDRLLGRRHPDPAPIASLLEILTRREDVASLDAAGTALVSIASQVQTDEIAGPRLEALRAALGPRLRTLLARRPDAPLHFEAALLATSWLDPEGFAAARTVLQAPSQDPSRRLEALKALIAAEDHAVLDTVETLLANHQAGSIEFRGRLLAALGRLDDPRVAQVVLASLPSMEPDLKPRAIALLTERKAWSRSLLAAIGQGKVAASALSVNQVRTLLASKDADLVKFVKAQWGTIREGRNPQREQVVTRMRSLLRERKGNAVAGHQVYKKLCAQCHKLHGEGQEVGPDITVNGRGSFEQLLSNVFDPSLVIGAAYQATTVATTEGRVLSGLQVENSPQRVVLKMQGGKLETIPREAVDEIKVSPLSLMPEDVEKQLKPQEIADLFAFLSLDKPPGDPKPSPFPAAGEAPPK